MSVWGGEKLTKSLLKPFCNRRVEQDQEKNDIGGTGEEWGEKPYNNPHKEHYIDQIAWVRGRSARISHYEQMYNLIRGWILGNVGESPPGLNDGSRTTVKNKEEEGTVGHTSGDGLAEGSSRNRKKVLLPLAFPAGHARP